MKELWRASNFGNYEVSDRGQIRNAKTSRILKQSFDNDGYPMIGLRSFGIRKMFRVGRLVASVFLGNCPIGYTVNHKDLDKKNSEISNLEYKTRLQNTRHAVANGAYRRGIDHPHAKLSPDKVRYIRSSSLTQLKLAKKFKVTEYVIWAVLHGLTWKEVT